MRFVRLAISRPCLQDLSLDALGGHIRPYFVVCVACESIKLDVIKMDSDDGRMRSDPTKLDSDDNGMVKSPSLRDKLKRVLKKSSQSSSPLAGRAISGGKKRSSSLSAGNLNDLNISSSPEMKLPGPSEPPLAQGEENSVAKTRAESEPVSVASLGEDDKHSETSSAADGTLVKKVTTKLISRFTDRNLPKQSDEELEDGVGTGTSPTGIRAESGIIPRRKNAN